MRQQESRHRVSHRICAHRASLYLFPTRRRSTQDFCRQQTHPCRIYSNFSQITDSLNIALLHPHPLTEFHSPPTPRHRHACATLWLRQGVPIGTAAKWFGHSPEVLLNTYTGVLSGDIKTARRRINSLFVDEFMRICHKPPINFYSLYHRFARFDLVTKTGSTNWHTNQLMLYSKLSQRQSSPIQRTPRRLQTLQSKKEIITKPLSELESIQYLPLLGHESLSRW